MHTAHVDCRVLIYETKTGTDQIGTSSDSIFFRFSKGYTDFCTYLIEAFSSAPCKQFKIDWRNRERETIFTRCHDQVCKYGQSGTRSRFPGWWKKD